MKPAKNSASEAASIDPSIEAASETTTAQPDPTNSKRRLGCISGPALWVIIGFYVSLFLMMLIVFVLIAVRG